MSCVSTDISRLYFTYYTTVCLISESACWETLFANVLQGPANINSEVCVSVWTNHSIETPARKRTTRKAASENVWLVGVIYARYIWYQ